eukprot:jgi/Chlat1/3492/Chrsp23S03681
MAPGGVMLLRPAAAPALLAEGGREVLRRGRLAQRAAVLIRRPPQRKGGAVCDARGASATAISSLPAVQEGTGGVAVQDPVVVPSTAPRDRPSPTPRPTSPAPAPPPSPRAATSVVERPPSRASSAAVRSRSPSPPPPPAPRPLDEQTRRRMETTHMMRSPSLNRGTAFTKKQRQLYNLRGLLPAAVETLDQQAARAVRQLNTFKEPINRYVYMSRLHATNETLYYKVLSDNLEELLPIVYTPTVGEACLQFSGNWRTAQGMYFNREDKGSIRDVLENWPHRAVDVVVVTDGGRILGLGDLGANGMPISVGKLSLYVAGGGFHPSRTLPVLLDVGTNNQDLLEDPLYVGSRHSRMEGQDYDAFVEEFVDAIKDKWPNALIQFEDFRTDKAIDLLARHRHRARCFNDDVQGTGAVIAAGAINATRMQQKKLSESRIVFFGAGSAAVGVAETIAQLIAQEGFTMEEARSRIWMVDSKGLITAARGDKLQEHKRPYARKDADGYEGASLLDTIHYVKPTALMGLSGMPGAFTQEVIEALCKHTMNPVIFPLSNPTSKAEISAENAVNWSHGNCIFAAGSPFPNVTYKGRTIVPMQGNNMFIFPGVGFGTVLSHATAVTDGMFLAAARALAHYVPAHEVAQGILFPSVSKVREISAIVAAAVMEAAYQEGVAGAERPADNLLEYVKQQMYTPLYRDDVWLNVPPYSLE